MHDLVGVQANMAHKWVCICDPDQMQPYLQSSDPDAPSKVPLFERSFGKPFWRHLQETPGLDAAFAAGMSDQGHGLHGKQPSQLSAMQSNIVLQDQPT